MAAEWLIPFVQKFLQISLIFVVIGFAGATFASVDSGATPRLSSMRRIRLGGVEQIRSSSREHWARSPAVARSCFNYDYSNGEIAEIAERSRSLAENASQTHIVFNNNASDYAPHAAARFRKALGQIVAAPARTAELF